MKEIWQNLKTWQKIAAIGGFLALIVVIVVSVAAIAGSESKVKIEFDGSVNIPTEELKRTREYLVGVIKDNTEDFDDNVVYVGKARGYEEQVDGDYTTATFIVDFDEIKESYRVGVTWPNPDDGSPNIYISCPIFDSKYPETKCVTEINNSRDIAEYLPYDGTLANGLEYEVSGDYDSGGFYITVSVDSCGNAGIIEEALKGAKAWINGLGIDANDYLFFAPTNYCDGEVVDDIPYSYVPASDATTNDAVVNTYLPYFVPGMYNVYPLTDENNDVTAIKAEISGCTDYQAEPMEAAVHDYLDSHGIAYPVEFEYCLWQE